MLSGVVCALKFPSVAFRVLLDSAGMKRRGKLLFPPQKPGGKNNAPLMIAMGQFEVSWVCKTIDQGTFSCANLPSVV